MLLIMCVCVLVCLCVTQHWIHRTAFAYTFLWLCPHRNNVSAGKCVTPKTNSKHVHTARVNSRLPF